MSNLLTPAAQRVAAQGLCAQQPGSQQSATLFFVHIFKAGGTTSRDMLRAYSEKCKLLFRQAGHCGPLPMPGWICTERWIDVFAVEPASRPALTRTDVVAGHIAWGIHAYGPHKPVFITCLRRPLDIFISARLYRNRNVLTTSSTSSQAVFAILKMGPFAGESHAAAYLSGVNRYGDSADLAIAHLQSRFAVVGILEEYSKFIDLVQRLIDPPARLGSFWRELKVKPPSNPSPISTGTVMNTILKSQPNFMATVNASLRDEWRVYEAATAVFRHQYAASVYGAASQYARTHNVTWMKG